MERLFIFGTKIVLYCRYQNIKFYSILVRMCADVFVCSCSMLPIFGCPKHSKCLVRNFLISVLIIHSLRSLSYVRSIASFKASFSHNQFILSSVFPSINCFTRQILRKVLPIQLAFLPFLYLGYSCPP